MSRRLRLLGGKVIETGWGGFRIPYSVNFASLPDGSLPDPLTGSTWAISNGAAINTPTLGAEKLNNTGIESALGAPAPGNWSDNGTATTYEQSSEQAYSGTYSLKTVSDATNEGGRQVIVVSLNEWYSITGWIYLVTGSFRFGDQNARMALQDDISTPTGSWVKQRHTGWVSTAGNLYCGSVSRTAVSQWYMDNMNMNQIVAATLPFWLPQCQTSNVIARITATMAYGGWAGVWICQDATKTNGIIGVHNGTKAALLKLVNGTITQLIAPTTATFGTGLEVRKSGTSVKLFSNGIQIGADQTVNDASIITNKVHGPLSAHPDTKLLSFDADPN